MEKETALDRAMAAFDKTSREWIVHTFGRMAVARYHPGFVADFTSASFPVDDIIEHRFENKDEADFFRAMKCMEAALAAAGSSGFPVGTAVIKPQGYRFPGEIRSGFTTIAGELRYAVEATGEGYAGMLHIFSPSQVGKP